MFNLKEATAYGVIAGTNYTSQTLTEMGFERRVPQSLQEGAQEESRGNIELNERTSGATSDTAAESV